MNANKLASRRSLKSDLARVDAHVIQPKEYAELPELTEEMLARAKVSKGGRPVSPNPRKLISLRLPADVIERWKATAGIDMPLLLRWLQAPSFRAAYRQARRELVEAGIGRIQAATGQAVETLLSVARHGRRDGDRIRASAALLDYAFRGLNDADLIHVKTPSPGEAVLDGTADVVATLAARLGQVDRSELPAVEKARLTALLADSLLRAIGVDVLDKRLQAMHAVLAGRQEPSRP